MVAKDPEARNVLTLALLNAHTELLAAIVEIFAAETESEAGEQPKDSQGNVYDILRVIFNQTYEGLPAFILVLSLHPFAQFRERVETCLSLLCDLAGEDNAWAVNTQDRLGRTVMHLAAQYQVCAEVWDKLKSAGGKLEVMDIEDRSVAYYQELAKTLCEADGPKTMIVTDHYLLKHTGFSNYANVMERVRQKDHQPENAERLMCLIDKERGALTQAAEFQRDKVVIKEVAKPAGTCDVLKIHDYRYIRDIM